MCCPRPKKAAQIETCYQLNLVNVVKCLNLCTVCVFYFGYLKPNVIVYSICQSFDVSFFLKIKCLKPLIQVFSFYIDLLCIVTQGLADQRNHEPLSDEKHLTPFRKPLGTLECRNCRSHPVDFHRSLSRNLKIDFCILTLRLYIALFQLRDQSSLKRWLLKGCVSTCHGTSLIPLIPGRCYQWKCQ